MGETRLTSKNKVAIRASYSILKRMITSFTSMYRIGVSVHSPVSPVAIFGTMTIRISTIVSLLIPSRFLSLTETPQSFVLR